MALKIYTAKENISQPAGPFNFDKWNEKYKIHLNTSNNADDNSLNIPLPTFNYDKEKHYEKNDLVVFNNGLYIAIAEGDITGLFDFNKWKLLPSKFNSLSDYKKDDLIYLGNEIYKAKWYIDKNKFKKWSGLKWEEIFEFEPLLSYEKGSMVIYNRKVYRANSNIDAGYFDAGKWNSCAFAISPFYDNHFDDFISYTKYDKGYIILHEDILYKAKQDIDLGVDAEFNNNHWEKWLNIYSSYRKSNKYELDGIIEHNKKIYRAVGLNNDWTKEVEFKKVKDLKLEDLQAAGLSGDWIEDEELNELFLADYNGKVFLYYNNSIWVKLDGELFINLSDYEFFKTEEKEEPLFSVTVDFTEDTPQEYIDIYGPKIDQAADFWSKVITGYKSLDGTDDLNTRGGVSIQFGFEQLDEGLLGLAFPSLISFVLPPNTKYVHTVTGEMYFSADSYPITDYQDNNEYNNFYAVVVHEMGHVLGFGTLWDLKALAMLLFEISEEEVNIGAPNLNIMIDENGFIGAKTLQVWQEDFLGHENDTFVPIEDEGSAGTAGKHWDEFEGGIWATGIVDREGRDMRDEVMTGWASNNAFMSRLTLASFEDMGYTIDYTIDYKDFDE
jgi:hypothetical protein